MSVKTKSKIKTTLSVLARIARLKQPMVGLSFVITALIIPSTHAYDRVTHAAGLWLYVVRE